MGMFSIWHWVIVLAVVFVMFGGGGKIVAIASDLGKSIPAFKRGIKDAKDIEREIKG